jgi:ABC-type bacteriocin/lantibiotic exporter with double-glycine peptidase domain
MRPHLEKGIDEGVICRVYHHKNLTRKPFLSNYPNHRNVTKDNIWHNPCMSEESVSKEYPSLEVRYIFQGFESRCVSTCLKMILNYYSIKSPSIKTIHTEAGGTKEGLEPARLTKYVESLGLDTFNGTADRDTQGNLHTRSEKIEMLKSCIQSGIPIMTGIFKSQVGAHSVVITSVSDTHVTVVDPGPMSKKEGIYRMEIDTFLTNWAIAGEEFFVVERKGRKLPSSLRKEFFSPPLENS